MQLLYVFWKHSFLKDTIFERAAVQGGYFFSLSSMEGLP